MIKEKIKASKLVITQYRKLFKQLRDIGNEHVSDSSDSTHRDRIESMINKIIHHYRVLCFQNESISSIMSQTSAPNHLDATLRTSNSCKGINYKSRGLVGCKNCKQNDLSVFCEYCFLNHGGHEGHEIKVFYHYGVCKNTFKHLFENQAEVQEAVEWTNSALNPLCRSFRVQTFNLLFSFLSFVDKLDDYRLMGTCDREKMEDLPDCLSELYERIIETILLAATRRICFKVILADLLIQRVSLRKQKNLTLLEMMLKQDNGWFDVLKHSVKMINHLVCFHEFNFHFSETIFSCLVDKLPQSISNEIWLSLLRAAEVDHPEVRKLILSGKTFDRLIEYLVETLDKEVDIYKLSNVEESIISNLLIIFNLLDGFFEISDYAIIFGSSEPQMELFLKLAYTFQYLDFFDLNMKEFNSSYVEAMSFLLTLEEMLICSYCNLLKKINASEGSKTTILMHLKKIKIFLDKYGTLKSLS